MKPRLLLVAVAVLLANSGLAASFVSPSGGGSSVGVTNAIGSVSIAGSPIGNGLTGIEFAVGSTGYVSSGVAIVGSSYPRISWGNSVFVATNGNDSTGARNDPALPFLTLRAAKNAATNGDSVLVMPGTYILTNSVLKNGVDWVLYGPMELRLTNSYSVADTSLVERGGWGIFDDRVSGVSTSSVHGIGSVKMIWHSGLPVVVDAMATYPTSADGFMGAIVVTNRLSRLSFRNIHVDLAGYVASAGTANAFHLADGTNIFENCSFSKIGTTNVLVYDPVVDDYASFSDKASGIYWEHSDSYFDGPFLYCDAYSIWANDANRRQGIQNLWVNVPNIYGKFYASGYTNGNWKVWILANEIASGTNGSISAVTVYDGGKFYVTAQKIGNTPNGNPNQNYVPVIESAGAAKLWVTTQKITGSNAPFVWHSTDPAHPGSGVTHITAEDYEDLGNVPVGFLVDRGELNIHGGRGTVTNGIVASVAIGGALNMAGAQFSNLSSSSNACIVTATNSVVLSHNTLVGPTNKWAVLSTGTNQIRAWFNAFNSPSTNVNLLGGMNLTNPLVSITP